MSDMFDKSKTNPVSASDFAQRFEKELLRQMELDRDWSDGSEINTWRTEVIEPVISAGVTAALQTMLAELKQSSPPKK